MNKHDEYYYMQKHLVQTQNKIETLERKKENCSSYKFEEVLNEIRVLRKIEYFLWNELN